MAAKQAMTKTELKGLLAARMRDPATSARDFIALAKRYDSLSAKHKKLVKLPSDTVNDAVLRLERQRTSTLKQAAVTNAPQGFVTPADAKAYLASGQTGMLQDALKEQMEAEWKAELEARRTTPAIRADVNE